MADYKLGTTFKVHNRILRICNINEFREPNMKYACDVYNDNNESVLDDVVFVGDSFLDRYEVINNG